ncbi:response regulator [Bradyrhizobium jicamae]|nr:response regulator [Bradyrhizobium jicamae]MBR0939515.1 response regulator [Bradyrhizobium jicamae]
MWRDVGRFQTEYARSAPVATKSSSESDASSLINMHGVRGLGILSQVRRERPCVDVIMITADGDAETRREVFDISAVGLMIKPIDFALLRRELDMRLGQAP